MSRSGGCIACQSAEFTRVPYSDHLAKATSGLASRVAHLVAPAVQKTFPSWGWFHRRTLFAPLAGIRICKICGHGAYAGEVSSAVLEAYYRGEYWSLMGQDPKDDPDPNQSKRARGQFEFIEKAVTLVPSVRVLEIGAGAALFSRYLRERKPGARVEVVEPGNSWSAYYDRHSVRVAARFFPLPETFRAQFDHIHTSHWLEHLANPKEALLKIRDLLTAGGTLFIEVPHCDASYFELDVGDSPHLHFFTLHSLRKLVESAGYTVLKIGAFGLNNREIEEIRLGRRPAAEADAAFNQERSDGDSLRLICRIDEKGGKMMNQLIHILLPVHNRREVTRRFIECLKRQEYSDYRLWLLDDGSTDGTAEMVKAEIPGATVVSGTGDWWWGGSLQVGYLSLQRARVPANDLVLIVNDDTEFEPDFLTQGVRALAEQPRGLVQAACFSRQNGEFLDAGVCVDWQRFSFRTTREAREVNCLSTRGLILTVGTFMELGGFHPYLLPHYLSDYEFTLRARRRGFRLATNAAFRLRVDESTTGSHGTRGSTLFARARNLFSKRSANNPLYWWSFVWLACPWRHLPVNCFRVLKGAVRNLKGT